MAGNPVIGPSAIAAAIGPFDQLDFLGSGTFGETYHVLKGSEEYALKVIHYAGVPPYLVEREVEALSRVGHPNVMGLKSQGVLSIGGQDYPYLECEYIDGMNVDDALRARALPSTPGQVRAFLAGLLSGVREIGLHGIVHRDIKPMNIMVRGGDWSQPVVLDFGVAKIIDMTSHTQTPAWRGTWQYMAPEQLRGKRASPRADLFALATVVYEVGTGVPPYLTPGMHRHQLLSRILSGPPLDPRSASRLFLDAEAEVVLRLLSAESHERLSVERALADLGGAP